MLKNCDGFSVIEVLGAFAIFLVLVSSIVPIMMKLYQERAFIDYKREALILLHNEKESFLYDSFYPGEREVTTSKRRYEVTLDNEGELAKICIGWEVAWGKHGKLCEYAKK